MSRGGNTEHSVMIKFEGFEQTMNELDAMGERGKEVVKRCLSDFKRRTPSWVGQAVAKKYNISKREVAKKSKNRLVSVKAYGDAVNNVFISFSGRPLTITHFSDDLKVPPPFTSSYTRIPFQGGYRMVRRREPVVSTVTILKGKPEPLKGKYGTPVFISKTKNTGGHYLPFQRTGNITKTGNVAFESIKTVSVPQMIKNEKVYEDIMKKIKKGMAKRIDNHMKSIFGE